MARKRRPTYPPLAGFAFGLFDLALESQKVIGLRVMKIALGGSTVRPETNRMVREKFDALREAGVDMMIAAATGRAEAAPVKAVAVYRRRVKANVKRLRP